MRNLFFLFSKFCCSLRNPEKYENTHKNAKLHDFWCEFDWLHVNRIRWEPDLQLQPAGISQRKDVLNVGNVESKLYVDFDNLKINPIQFEDFKINIWMYSKFEVLQLWTLKVLNLRTSNLMWKIQEVLFIQSSPPIGPLGGFAKVDPHDTVDGWNPAPVDR